LPEQSGSRSSAAELEMTRDGEARIFLQDVPGVLAPGPGRLCSAPWEMFGEIAALGRTPRTATIVADQTTQMLEIRWQGLREIRKYSPEWETADRPALPRTQPPPASRRDLTVLEPARRSPRPDRRRHAV
jgi:hypothetical protein